MGERLAGRMVFVVCLLLACLAGGLLICRAEGRRQEDWIEYIEQICEERDICPELVEAVIEQESGWDTRAINGDCVGLMQINQISHWQRMQKLGVIDLMDPYENILIGVDLLEELFHTYGDAAAVLMYYNAGYSDRYGLGAYQQGAVSDYAKQVLARAADLERLHGK